MEISIPSSHRELQNLLEKTRMEWVAPSQIDTGEEFFRHSGPAPEGLLHSIRRWGVLTPVVLQRLGRSRPRVVSGFRRVEAALELGLEQIPARVSDSDDSLLLFRAAVEENLATRGLKEAEKGRVVYKFRHNFGIEEGLLLEHFLPPLGIRADRSRLRYYLSLGTLDSGLLLALERGLDPEVALKLAAWEARDRDFLLARILALRAGRNPQRRLLTLLEELLDLEGPGQTGTGESRLVRLWSESGAQRIESEGERPLPQRLARILQLLEDLRFPRLAGTRKEFARRRRSLELPSRVRIREPRYFEEPSLEFRLEASSCAELLELAGSLEEAARSGALQSLFELL